MAETMTKKWNRAPFGPERVEGICCSGSGDDPGEQEKPVDPPPSPDDGVDWSKIDPKATVRGGNIHIGYHLIL